MTTPDPEQIAAGLAVKLVLQGGSIDQFQIVDNAHNRQLQNYIARHESFALVSRPQHLEGPTQ